MRVQILSDLHIRIWEKELGPSWYSQDFPAWTQTGADALILVGDAVSLRRENKRWSQQRLLELCSRYRHVLFVAGNHEFYGTSILDGQELLREIEAQTPGLQVLRTGRAVVIEGHRFLGDTMWQPGPREGERTSKINDHYQIRGFPAEAGRQYQSFRTWLEKELCPDDIVVTHHAPSLRSVDAQWRGDPCNRWFITDEMEALITEWRPRLWIHGHTHSRFDYKLVETRVCCNPLGYPGERTGFNPQLVLDLDQLTPDH